MKLRSKFSLSSLLVLAIPLVFVVLISTAHSASSTSSVIQINNGKSALTTNGWVNYVSVVEFTGLTPGSQINKVAIDIFTASGDVRYKVYQDDGAGGNPSTLLGESDSFAAQTGTVYNSLITPAIVPPSGNVWVGFEPTSNSMVAYYTAGSPTAHKYVAHTYGTGPNPFGSAVINSNVELWAGIEIGPPTAPSAPQPPTGLAATVSSSSQINLSWTAPSNNGGSAITGYEIDRSTDGGTTWSVLVSNTASTGTTYSNTGLTAATTYTYRVSAINSVGTSSPSNIASATTLSGSTTGTIILNGIQTTSGTVSLSPYQISLSNFNVGTGSDRILVVGVEANNNNVISITFGGVQLTKAVSSFYNNDAEFWYMKNPSGTANIVVTMGGPTSVIVGAYSFFGVDQTNPIPTNVANHNSASSNPTISITTAYPDSWVIDLPSIYGGVTLGSPTCTQSWDVNMAGTITGASSSTILASPGSITCSWTSSSGELWDDTAIELKTSSTTSTTVPGAPTGLTATAASSSQINLSWVAPTNNGGSAITGYKIERSTDSGSTWSVLVSNTGSAGSTYSNTGLASSTTYTYRVSAINSVGTSSPSNIASATTGSGTTQVTITVKSVGLTGNTITGLWTTLISGGKTISTGYTTKIYTVTAGNLYTVTVANYQNYVFNHWDDGTTNPYRTITPTQNIVLTAYYQQ